MYTASRRANDLQRFRIGASFQITGTPLKLRWLKGEFVMLVTANARYCIVQRTETGGWLTLSDPAWRLKPLRKARVTRRRSQRAASTVRGTPTKPLRQRTTA